jgi:hypothetical protein
MCRKCLRRNDGPSCFIGRNSFRRGLVRRLLIMAGLQPDPNVNLSTCLGLGLNCESGADQPRTLFHAPKAETTVQRILSRIETSTIIGNCQVK